MFSCPFFHVHQSAKPDVQMCCVGKQALVWANIALMRVFLWAWNQAVHRGGKEKWGWVKAGPSPWAWKPFFYSLTPRGWHNYAQQGSERWEMLQDLLSTSFPSRLNHPTLLALPWGLTGSHAYREGHAWLNHIQGDVISLDVKWIISRCLPHLLYEFLSS